MKSRMAKLSMLSFAIRAGGRPAPQTPLAGGRPAPQTPLAPRARDGRVGKEFPALSAVSANMV